MAAGTEIWHVVEARRDDGAPTTFRIRELEPTPELATIFVAELTYPTTELSRMPSAADYRALARFEDEWLRPACAALGWVPVGVKIEDGSFFIYAYGSGDPQAFAEKLGGFGAKLVFYDDHDPDWGEYATLRELLEQAQTIEPEPAPAPKAKPKATTRIAKPKKAKATPKGKGKAKPKPKAKPAKRKKAR